jgi:hypothetical protein
MNKKRKNDRVFLEVEKESVDSLGKRKKNQNVFAEILRRRIKFVVHH